LHRASWYLNFAWLFLFSYHQAILEQPQQAILPAEYATIVPAVLFVLGQIFVVTSTWALGITGTFLGDYFGILMDSRVEGYVARLLARESFANFFFLYRLTFSFPFNVLRDPMYVGSTMCFAATALWYVICL
jgi:phosphatidylethanolamine N-methyltransferase